MRWCCDKSRVYQHGSAKRLGGWGRKDIKGRPHMISRFSISYSKAGKVVKIPFGPLFGTVFCRLRFLCAVHIWWLAAYVNWLFSFGTLSLVHFRKVSDLFHGIYKIAQAVFVMFVCSLTSAGGRSYLFSGNMCYPESRGVLIGHISGVPCFAGWCLRLLFLAMLTFRQCWQQEK